ncbi:MAG: hypothetical protein AB1422_18290 [bacterium]
MVNLGSWAWTMAMLAELPGQINVTLMAIENPAIANALMTELVFDFIILTSLTLVKNFTFTL